jgi:hypothetical protein
MWTRNLLLLGLCLLGVLVLASNLAPSRRPPQWDEFDAHMAVEDQFQETVEKVNTTFRDAWSDQELTPAPRADDLHIARRLSLALTGTIPSLEEIRMFQERPEDHRVDWWISGLLKDRRSSDYLAERLSRAYVGVDGGPFLVYRRRRFVSWLSERLHENQPYDQLVRDLIASEGLWTSEPATNFITAAVRPDSDEGVQENVMASRVSRAFLGVRLDCAECHDHPFDDRWKQSSFHGLAAFFGSIEMSRALLGIRDGNSQYKIQDRETLEDVVYQPEAPYDAHLCPPEGTPRARLAAWITHPENKPFARATVNRMWAIMFGRPLVDPVDNIPTDGDVPPAMQLLADDFVAHGYDLQRLMRLIAATEAFQLDSAADPAVPDHEITEAHDLAWAAFPLTRLRPEQVVGSLQQAASLATVDYQSHVLLRIARAAGQNDFVKQYGDQGADELADHGGTIPQRLLMMNGDIVKNSTEEGILTAPVQIAQLAPTDAKAVETAYLVVLSRMPTPEEAAHFTARLAGTRSTERNHALEDLYWTLVNSTEFSWNH